MIAATAAWVAVKKAALATPVVVASLGITIPMFFSPLGEFLGPHVVAAIGAVIGTAVRYQLFRMPWRRWPLESLAAAMLGLMFGQVEIPVVGALLQRVSPDMYPLSNGTAIGLLLTLLVGLYTDFREEYRKKLGGLLK